jgi:hypothetical protein
MARQAPLGRGQGGAREERIAQSVARVLALQQR